MGCGCIGWDVGGGVGVDGVEGDVGNRVEGDVVDGVEGDVVDRVTEEGVGFRGMERGTSL